MKKIAIVTGASRGIGRAVAERLGQDGFAVVVNYLSNASEAEEVVAEIKVIGGEAIAVKADVANQTDVEQLFEETMKKFGSVDVVLSRNIPALLRRYGANLLHCRSPFYLCFEHVDNLGAYRIPSETGLLPRKQLREAMG